MPTQTIVLADDHPLILDAVANLLRRDKDLKVVARCNHVEETIQAVRMLKPDLLLLDVNMHGRSGLEVLQVLAQDQLATRTIVLTGEIKPAELSDAVRLGARGLVLKELAPALILQCIRRVLAGELWFEKHLAGAALSQLASRGDDDDSPIKALSRRETEVLYLAIAAMSNQQIGKKLFITEGTVKIHLHSIYNKLGIENRMQLMAFARKHRLV